MRDIYSEYVAGAPDLMEFYAKAPSALFDERPEPVEWDSSLIQALSDYNERPVPHAGVALVTGQQPALFTGPLYTVYKAATAVILARRLSERSGVPHVPVFWVGSDDHDFEEARSAWFLTKDHTPLELRYEPNPPVDGRPMFNVPLEPSLHDLVSRAAAETPGSEFRAEIEGLLHETLDASSSLAEWSARLLGHLFRHTPLLVFAPHWPEARRLAAPVLEREITEPLRSTRLLNAAGERLAGLGFDLQLVKAPDECNFFLVEDGRRRKVVFRDGQFLLPETSAAYRPDEMLELLRTAPERFSPNVALRCVVQQKLFGAAAYIAGPGEVAYWAELRPVFEEFGLPMPAVYPRARCTITSLKLNKLRRRFGFALDDLTLPDDDLLARALPVAVDGPARRELARRRPAVESALDDLARALANADPTAGAMARNLQSRVAAELDKIDRALMRQDRAQVEAVERQVARLRNALAPWRRPQERVYTVFSYVFPQGLGFIQRLLDELDVESFAMNEVEL